LTNTKKYGIKKINHKGGNMIKTNLITDKIQRTINNYKLTHIETVKLNNLKNSFLYLNYQEINEKNKLIISNNRGMLISMIKDALTDYDYVLATELTSVLKVIPKI
jgi:hypothetical protein